VKLKVCISGVSSRFQQSLIQTVVDELNGVGLCPSKGESAARTAWVMDRMVENGAADRSLKKK